MRGYRVFVKPAAPVTALYLASGWCMEGTYEMPMIAPSTDCSLATV